LTCERPDGGVEYFGYSARGLIAHTNRIGETNFFTYDAASRKTYETNADDQVLSCTYNTAGDLLSPTDGKGQTTQWGDDDYGRVTNKLDLSTARAWPSPTASGPTASFYDAAGRLTNPPQRPTAPISSKETFGPLPGGCRCGS